MTKIIKLIVLAILATLSLLLFVNPVYAAYGNIPDTHLDPTIMKIDEETYLGVKLVGDYAMTDKDGQHFSLADYLGKPTILVLSYYSCDGACSTINRNLRQTLEEVERWNIGDDYRVLTVSFDPHDDSKTLTDFLQHAGFVDGLPRGWQMATLDNDSDIKKLTESVGFNFFWSPRDRMFLHPNVYIMLSPEGRVIRYLYGVSVGAQDITLSITKAKAEEVTPSNVINFVLGACYSYNYEEGRYTINYPIFIGLGALFLGVLLIIVGTMVMKRRRRIHENEQSLV
ncbi:MAG: SCO family protein [Mariprofundales bacterium]